jgi:YegS/Rv2252/BmrU family lipid kinase
MKVAIILNGISRKKKFFYTSIYPSLQQNFKGQVFETQHAQHAIELASNAVNEKFDYILSAGGDGTLNQVLNGVLLNQQNESSLPAIGIIPLGTGNDFAKMCGLKPDANQISNLLTQNNPKPTDIGKLNCRNENGETITRYFINVCSLGMGPEAVRRLLKSDRSLGPTITYLKAITETFFTHKPQEIIVNASNWEWRGKMRVLAIANGKSFGNAMYIAPEALPDDGLFSTFLAKEMPLLKFLMFLQQVKAKKKIKNNLIMYDTCTTIEIIAPEPCPIEAEGEWMGWLPAKIEMQLKRIKFLR